MPVPTRLTGPKLGGLLIGSLHGRAVLVIILPAPRRGRERAPAVSAPAVEAGPYHRLGEVVDVGVPGAVEDAGEHEAGVVVEDHVPCVMQGADLAHRRMDLLVIRRVG